MKKMYQKGGSLKPVPSDNKGLAKLPTEVRNKMGYMKKGGEKLLSKMAQYGSEITPGNKDAKPMISPEEVNKMQKDYSKKAGSSMDFKPSSMINADNKYGQLTSAPRPAKKQFGGTTGRRTYSGKKK